MKQPYFLQDDQRLKDFIPNLLNKKLIKQSVGLQCFFNSHIVARFHHETQFLSVFILIASFVLKEDFLA